MQLRKKSEIKRRRQEFTGRFYEGNRAMLAVLTVLIILEKINGVVYAELERQFMDFFTGDSSMPIAAVFSFALFYVLGYGCVLLAKSVAEPAFKRQAMNRYKEQAFLKLTGKSIGSFSREDTSRYLSMMTNDAQEVEDNYLSSIPELIGCAVCFLLALASSARYNPVLTAISLATAAIPLLAAPVQGNVMGKQAKQVSDRNESYVGCVKDWLSGFSVVKSFCAEREAIASFQKKNDALEEAKYRKNKWNKLFWILSAFLTFFSEILLYVVGAVMILGGADLTVGALLAIAVLRNSYSEVMRKMPEIWADRKAAIALIDKLASLLAENVRKEGEKIPAKLTDGITFEGVSFAYEEGKPVLQNVSQRFEAGKSYAIVGASGSGKSTLLNLLLGSTDAYEGEICFDGKELRGIDEDSLYELMTPVQQNVFVFNDTIRNNVTMFREFSDEQVERAIRLSGLSKLIEERGEDYVCGENGNGLSGGERQRISIARAILRGAPVLLVDEATAALDADTASAVTGAILDIDSLTRIVVTHRLEAALLARYDEILVMKNGNICEKGTFADLMEQKEMFYSLFTIASSSAFA